MNNGAASRGFADAMALLIVLASCAAEPMPPAPEPPVIEWAGVPSEIRIGPIVTYVQPDGGTVEVETEGVRSLTPAGWSGDLVIVGSDAEGMFVATYLQQEGLPDGCYVENEFGVDRGEHIEARGVLWPKSSSFRAAEPVARDAPYPAGTRFCFDRTGRITSTVAP